ncbi:MAG: hypothetical protein H6Q73_2573 [Firmicutes bacterium]|nr:hypothetical protein [Bacillota bacterium]
MIKVIKGMVKAGGKFHSVSETITGLSDKEEARLVSMGVCEIIVSETIQEYSSAEISTAETNEKSQKTSKINAATTDVTDEIKLNVDDVVVSGK